MNDSVRQFFNLFSSIKKNLSFFDAYCVLVMQIKKSKLSAKIFN